jgi:hypothetical protein
MHSVLIGFVSKQLASRIFSKSIMVIFATPDFGASFTIALFLLIGFVVLLFLMGVGVVLGIKMLRDMTPGRRKMGFYLILISILFPLICFLAPPHIVRLAYGNYPIGSYPLGKIHEGMTCNEVEAILGTPHQRTKESKNETWIYWIDSFAISYCGVDFGPDGHVSSIYGN